MTHTKKEYADEYHEQTKQISLDDITAVTLRKSLDFTYKTHNGTKTIRSHSAHSSRHFSDDLYKFFDDDTQYGFNIQSNTLYSIDRSRETPLHTIASAEDIVKVEQITFPTHVPVVGAIQKDVPATIYYRSPRSDQMQSIEIEVSHIENDILFEGESTKSGDWIKALCIHERTIEKNHPQQYLGRVTRVEFPRGHAFTVNIEGLSDDKIEDMQEQIESEVADIYQLPNDATVSVSHDGAIHWE